jgi:hypothetical protein
LLDLQIQPWHAVCYPVPGVAVCEALVIMAIIEAEPYPFDFDPARTSLVIIDMQRDFLEPGGFGAALGNDVFLLRRTIAPIRRCSTRRAPQD